MNIFTITTTILSLLLNLISLYLSQTNNSSNTINNSLTLIKYDTLHMEQNINISTNYSVSTHNKQLNQEILNDNRHFIYEILSKVVYILIVAIIILFFYNSWSSYSNNTIDTLPYFLDRFINAFQYACINTIRCLVLPTIFTCILFIFKSFRSQYDFRNFHIIIYSLLLITSIAFFVTLLLVKYSYFMPTQSQGKNIGELRKLLLTLATTAPIFEVLLTFFSLHKLMHTVIFRVKKSLLLRTNFNHIVSISLLPTMFLLATLYNIFILLQT